MLNWHRGLNALAAHSQAGSPATKPGNRGGFRQSPLTRKQEAQNVLWLGCLLAVILGGSLTPTTT